MKIRVVDNSYSHVTRERDPSDRWDADDTASYHNIEGIQIVPGRGNFYDLETTFPVVREQYYYLVYGIYSTGDSFSHHEGIITYVDLYFYECLAIRCRTLLEWHYEKAKDDHSIGAEDRFSVEIPTGTGGWRKFGVPWIGYFERLTALEILEVQITR